MATKLNQQQTHELLALLNLYNWGSNDNAVIQLAYALEKEIRTELKLCDKLDKELYTELRQKFYVESKIEKFMYSGTCGVIVHRNQVKVITDILDKRDVKYVVEDYQDDMLYCFVGMNNTSENLNLLNEILSNPNVLQIVR